MVSLFIFTYLIKIIKEVVKKGIVLLAISFILLIASVLIQWAISGEGQLNNNVNILEQRLNRTELEIKQIGNTLSSEEINDLEELAKRFRKTSAQALIFKDGQTINWTSREIPNARILKRLPADSTLSFINGSRFYQITTVGLPDNKILVGYVPLFNEEQSTNALLKQGFYLNKRLEATFSQSKNPSFENLPIKSVNDNVIGFVQPVITPTSIPFLVTLTWLSGMLMLLIGLIYFIRIRPTSWKRIPTIIPAIGAILVWRYMLLNTNLGILDQWRIFKPEVYANTLLSPSLGALLITIGLGVLVMRFWYTRPTIGDATWFKKYFNSNIRVIYFLAGLIIFGWLTTLVLKSILLDSSLRLSVEQIQEMDGFSVLGIVCVMLAIILFFYYSYRIIRHIKKQKIPILRVVIYWVLLAAAFVLITKLLDEEIEWFLPIWLLAYLLVMLLFLRKQEYLSNFLQIMSLVALFSIYASYYHGLHEKENLLLSVNQIADNLYDGEDPYASYLLEDAVQKIQEDKRIVNDIKSPFISENITLNRIRSRYRYLPTYSKDLSLKESTDSMHTAPVIEADLSIPDINIYNVSIPILDNGNIIKILQITLTNSKLNVDSRFQRTIRGLSQNESEFLPKEISYTMFENGKPYFTKGFSPVINYDNDVVSKMEPNKILIKSDGKQLNYYFSPEEGELLVMSLIKRKQLSGYLSLFSYNFSLLTLTLLVTVLLVTFFFINPGAFFTNSLLNRLQYSVLLMLFLIIGFIGALAFYNFKQDARERIQEDNRDNLRFLISTYNSENKGVFREGSFIDFLSEKANIQGELLHYFNIDGKLAYSNDQTLLDEGIWSGIIEPNALYEIRNLNNASYVQRETIGQYDFYGSYVAVKSGNANIKGVLYTPMLDITDNVLRELRPIYVTLLNVFTLIMLLATLAALFITNSFSGFLKRLRKTVNQTTLGGEEQTLRWPYKDEVGELVTEYNAMVEKLEESAILLARGERESAWRDMAKQVAHEIKNPLTPMKLSIQQLQRSLKDNQGHSVEQSARTLETLVSQIDHLSRIVSDFSTIAKMPLPVNQEMSLSRAIIDLLDLFDNNPNYRLEFIDNVDHDANIYADPTMVSRVLNNVLKNASQALQPEKNGIIILEFNEIEDGFTIAIRDNGKGIALQDQPKIFTPNFTTKSGGSGLGLMMSKKIMELEKGDISFTTQVDVGTVFTITFPTKRAFFYEKY